MMMKPTIELDRESRRQEVVDPAAKETERDFPGFDNSLLRRGRFTTIYDHVVPALITKRWATRQELFPGALSVARRLPVPGFRSNYDITA